MEDEYKDIHNFNAKMQGIERKILSDKKILSQNKRYIIDFKEMMHARGLKLSTIHKDLYAMWFVAHNLDKDFKKCRKEDIVKVCGIIERQEWTDKTKRNHIVAIKKAWKFLSGNDEKGVYPKEVKWLDTSIKKNRGKLPEEILSEAEIQKMLEVATNPRDKAFISLAYETGGRIGEILNVKIKHIVLQDSIGFVMLNGKTGMRRVPIIMSVPLLAEYLNVHPSRNNNDEFLFFMKRYLRGRRSDRSFRRGYTNLSYEAARRLLEELGERAGIKKHLHPHLLRHSSATRAAKFMTESQMKQFYGWTGGSDMPSTYVHLSGRDMESAVKKMYGVEIKEEENVRLTVKTCHRCKHTNSPDAKFCNGCGTVLDIQTAMNMNTRLFGILQNSPDLLTKTDEEILEEHKIREKVKAR